MLKRRVAAVEKRLAGLGRPTEKPHLVFRFSDGTEPPGEKDEAQNEKDGPAIVFKMPRPRAAESERILRFDFGDGGQARRTTEKPIDAAEISHPTEREKARI